MPAGYIKSIFFGAAEAISIPDFGPAQNENLVLVPTSGMGQTLISRQAVSLIHFDPSLTSGEDDDFSVRAREKNFKIIADASVRGFDVNVNREKQSDIHIDMPLRAAMSHMRKKSKAQAFASTLNPTWSYFFFFFIKYKKRYTYYLGYIPTIILFILGVFLANIVLLLIFPVYLCLYAALQFKHRGIKKGLKAVSRSFLVGVPTTALIMYYLLKRVGNRKHSY